MPDPLVTQALVRQRAAQTAAERARDDTIEELTDDRPFIQKLLSAPLDFTRGIAAGVANDPLFQVVEGLVPPLLLMDAISDRAGLPASDDMRERINLEIEGRKLSEIGEVAGGLAPSFASGVGLFTLGRAAAVKALQMTGSRIGQLSPRLAAQAQAVSARAAGANRLGAGEIIPKPGIERAAEAIGGSLGIGALGAAEELARGGKYDDALQSALLGAGLALALEGAFIGGARLLGRGREITGAQVAKRFAQVGGPKQIQAIREGNITRLQAARTTLEKAIQAERMQAELVTQAVAQRAGPAGRATARAAIRDLRGTRTALVETQRRAKSVKGEVKAIQELINPTKPVPLQYTRLDPFDPTGERRRVLAQLFLKGLATPEGFLRGMGVSGVRFLQAVTAAEHEFATARSITAGMIGRLRKETASLLGVTARSARRDGSYLLPAVDVYEKKGLEGVRQWYLSSVRQDPKKANRMVEVFKEIEGLKGRYDQLAALGAQPPMSQRDLRVMGVQSFFPHMRLAQADDELFKNTVNRLMGQGLKQGEAEVATAKAFFSQDSRYGLRQFGSQLHRREIRGSLQDKVKSGMPFEKDPLVALERYSLDIDRSLAYGKRFGFDLSDLADVRRNVRESTALGASKAQTRRAVLGLTAREGGSVPMMSTIVDEMLFDRYYPQAMRRLAQSITSLEVAAKLSFAVIPNMSQTSNTILLNGTRNTLKGMKDLLGKETRHHLNQVLGLNESLFQSIRRSYANQTLPDSILDRLADISLTVTGFSATERMNRLIAGSSAYHMISDTMAKAISGKLKGRTLSAARRRFASLGLDLDDATQGAQRALDQGANWKEALNTGMGGVGELDNALFAAAKITQFIPDVTRRPVAWQHPIGRIATQFKTFALNQGRFFRDQIVHEAALGNMRPVALLLSVYPLAGDLVREAQVAAKGQRERKENGVARYIDDITALGALGMVQSFGTSLKYGDLGGFVLGPAFSDADAGLEAIYELAVEGRGPRKLQRFVNRQPVVRATRRLVEVPQEMFREDIERYADLITQGESPQAEAIPITELLNESASRLP